MLDIKQTKDALSLIATPVSIVTTTYKDLPYGFTVSSFSSISISPPTMMIAVDQGHSIHHKIVESKCFVLNILNSEQHDLSNLFAYGKPEDRFNSSNWRPSKRSLPIIYNSLISFECEIINLVSVGSHTCIIGNVLEIYQTSEVGKKPLVYCNRGYREIKELP